MNLLWETPWAICLGSGTPMMGVDDATLYLHKVEMAGNKVRIMFCFWSAFNFNTIQPQYCLPLGAKHTAMHAGGHTFMRPQHVRGSAVSQRWWCTAHEVPCGPSSAHSCSSFTTLTSATTLDPATFISYLMTRPYSGMVMVGMKGSTGTLERTLSSGLWGTTCSSVLERHRSWWRTFGGWGSLWPQWQSRGLKWRWSSLLSTFGGLYRQPAGLDHHHWSLLQGKV